MVKSNKRRDDERRSAASAKVAQMQRDQQAQERRRRALIVSAVAVAAIVVIVGGFILYQTTKDDSKDVAGTGVGGSTADYGFVVGKASAPASMVIYEDFQCPICKSFEELDGDTIEKYVDDGTLKVEYRPISFLDRMSSTNYSTRSLNAAACVSDATDITTFKKFHDFLYANQPPEQSAGLTDDQLIDYAKQAGASSPAVASCIKDQTFEDWTGSATDAASKAGISGTPTVKLNGEDIAGSISSVDTLSQAIEAAAGTS